MASRRQWWRRGGALLALLALTLPLSPLGAASGAATRATPLLIARVPQTASIYVVASRACASSPCLELERTDDLGATFSPRVLPPYSGAPGSSTGTLQRLSFANLDDGYILAGTNTPTTLYVTTDGARSWHARTIASGATIFSLTVTGTRLYAVVADCHGPSNRRSCADYRLARAGLGATAWTFVTLPSSSLKLGSFDGTVGADGDHVWISEQTRAALLYSSSNAGATWSARSEAGLGSVSGCALSVMSPTVIWAGCPTGMMESFFYSSDAGVTWRPVLQRAYAGTGGGFFAPVSTTTAYLDYGQTARNVYRVSAPSLRERAVGELDCASVVSSAFVNANDGAAVCSKVRGATMVEVLEVTTDGGSRWSERGLPASRG